MKTNDFYKRINFMLFVRNSKYLKCHKSCINCIGFNVCSIENKLKKEIKEEKNGLGL